jgi:uncharacterized membrane protein
LTTVRWVLSALLVAVVATTGIVDLFGGGVYNADPLLDLGLCAGVFAALIVARLVVRAHSTHGAKRLS